MPENYTDNGADNPLPAIRLRSGSPYCPYHPFHPAYQEIPAPDPWSAAFSEEHNGCLSSHSSTCQALIDQSQNS